MCGIFFSAAKSRPILPDRRTKDGLAARGPDSYEELSAVLHAASGDIYLTFISSVLALRGDHIQEQPLYDPLSGSVLCWNGEAWKIGGSTIEGNDSARVFDLLLHASQAADRDHRQTVVKVLQAIAGPFAFVFYDAPTSTIFYGRDRLGRRSLLLSRDQEKSLTLCSAFATPVGMHITEVATTSIHFIAFKDGNITASELPWSEPLPVMNKMRPSSSLTSSPTSASVESFLEHLKNALKLRVVDIPSLSQGRWHTVSAKVAILFSGGLDCALLARLVHEILPQDEDVDLLNVAFENPRTLAALAKGPDSAYELCPDRVTGRRSFSELRQVCPHRRWKFVAVNVPYVESQAYKSTIQQLMHPHDTEMDLSIAMALWFAARGTGFSSESAYPALSETDFYNSDARVLLSGLGADELYGGYARHAAAFARAEFAGLADELELDFARIGSRNLGRDDRVMSDWGKEVRYPYLDEDFVRFSLGLPVWEKCGFRPGKHMPKHYEECSQVTKPEDLEPAKMLLRLAMWKLGMHSTATERKRAIQFGARTAKMDIGKGRTKGTDVLMPTS
ncbi:hypothetical protein H2200_007816 [Cladophialophora chaetospira]|uniref:Glutamine amidotransferase type-2 domain-containing protein n=1 Tax=Cladophialophora chaetospira TaxID=386627 RepID=A0AA39CGY4_9EURO|nr:hypothetical protein H2200_007816 [Cladophialophora chaetospira]